MDNGESWRPPGLHQVAQFGGAPEAVRQQIADAADIDHVWWGRTALFDAVICHQWEVAQALAAAGADIWREQVGGWSAARLALAGPVPQMFEPFTGDRAPAALSAGEQEAVARAARIIAVFRGFDPFAASFACIAGITAADALRRLGAESFDVEDPEEAWQELGDPEPSVVGITDVPGGCVVAQQSGYAASTPAVMERLTAGTHGYGMFSNPKSGNQGTIFRNSENPAWDLHPGGGGVHPGDDADEVLRVFLYRSHALAYCADFAGLEPVDRRAFAGPPDIFAELPAIDLWRRS
ncbi:hypothetical protein KOI35_16540 [Actinoplanes bogorensis]|uniref:Uncharacterized protein n=1 Tax=Paractinoplanes bogorensis TaxID=1610840 RepID=A0ABS5YNS2_9ACTN|nr:DUF6461 domain-containing protein [Actinoplanes bogorensis]MBU2665112.1 hypothetical protein [Actinoplanes bogorensis]